MHKAFYPVQEADGSRRHAQEKVEGCDNTACPNSPSAWMILARFSRSASCAFYLFIRAVPSTDSRIFHRRSPRDSRWADPRPRPREIPGESSFWRKGRQRPVEGPAGQQFAPFQRPFESAIAVGYVFQFSGRSRNGLEDHAELHLRVRG